MKNIMSLKKYFKSINESQQSNNKEEIRDLLVDFEDDLNCRVRIDERDLTNDGSLTKQYHIRITFRNSIDVDKNIVESIQRLHKWAKGINSETYTTFSFRSKPGLGNQSNFSVYQDGRELRSGGIKWTNWPKIYDININLCI